MSENLDKKLGIWGKDKILREDGKIHAIDYYCIRCYGKNKLVQANRLWPMMDPDIPFFPYCKQCVDDLVFEMMIKLGE